MLFFDKYKRTGRRVRCNNLDGNCLVSYTYDAWGNFTSSAMVGTLTSEEVVAIFENAESIIKCEKCGHYNNLFNDNLSVNNNCDVV